MRTAVNLINFSPVTVLDRDVPDIVLTRNDFFYDHLRVFNYGAYVKRSKLDDDEAKPCIFMRYGHVEFRHRLWDLVNKKIVMCRDVVFLKD